MPIAYLNGADCNVPETPKRKTPPPAPGRNVPCKDAPAEPAEAY